MESHLFLLGMSLKDLENPDVLEEESEEDEEMYIPVPFRFHDLAQRDEYPLLAEEIDKNNKLDYNPHVRGTKSAPIVGGSAESGSVGQLRLHSAPHRDYERKCEHDSCVC